MVGIGVACQDVYNKIDEVLPKNVYKWSLNPGHYTGQDEWVGSPMFPGTKAVLKSGMMLQMDIIPSVAGYGGTSVEDGIAIADEELRKEIAENYPDTWKRIQDRRTLTRENLLKHLSDNDFMEKEADDSKLEFQKQILTAFNSVVAAPLTNRKLTVHIRICIEVVAKKY